MLVGKVSVLCWMLLVFRVMTTEAMVLPDSNININPVSLNAVPDVKVLDPLLQHYFKAHEDEILQNLMTSLRAPADTRSVMLTGIRCAYTNIIPLVKIFDAIKDGNRLRAALFVERMDCVWSLPTFLHDATSKQVTSANNTVFDILQAISSVFPKLKTALMDPSSLRLRSLRLDGRVLPVLEYMFALIGLKIPSTTAANA